jgi:hypothetical protein
MAFSTYPPIFNMPMLLPINGKVQMCPGGLACAERPILVIATYCMMER